MGLTQVLFFICYEQVKGFLFILHKTPVVGSV